MDIFIPKYKEIYIRGDADIGLKTGFKGEYRAILTAENGEVKSSTGWKPNTVLNNGLALARNTNFFAYVYLGTSSTPVDITQTGLQGSRLSSGTGYATMGTVTYTANNGAPDYELVTIEKMTFVGGNCTGTIGEFVCAPSGGWSSNSGVRVVLDTPIVKGDGDELTIEHRLTFYPQLSDATGVIDISGVAYNYTIRHTNADAVPYRHFDNLAPSYRGVMWFTSNDIGSITDQPSFTGAGFLSSSVQSSGGTLGSYYANEELFMSINGEADNRNIRSVYGTMRGIASNGQFGMQMQIGKVSDDSPLFKADTHELILNWRTFQQRYVP